MTTHPLQDIIQSLEHHGDIHHAYCIQNCQPEDGVYTKLVVFIEKKLNFPLQANPDFSSETFETFGIDESRVLKERSMLRPVIHARKIFFIHTGGITIEAQNALLKLFEEPTPNTHFFLFIPSVSAATLLPTLRSRLSLIEVASESEKRNLGSNSKSGPDSDAAPFPSPEVFLAAKKGTRLKMIAPLIEEKSRARALDFLNMLEAFMVEQGIHRSAEEAKSLASFFAVKKYIIDRSSSIKMILEHCALVLPIV